MKIKWNREISRDRVERVGVGGREQTHIQYLFGYVCGKIKEKDGLHSQEILEMKA